MEEGTRGGAYLKGTNPPKNGRWGGNPRRSLQKLWESYFTGGRRRQDETQPRGEGKGSQMDGKEGLGPSPHLLRGGGKGEAHGRAGTGINNLVVF